MCKTTEHQLALIDQALRDLMVAAHLLLTHHDADDILREMLHLTAVHAGITQIAAELRGVEKIGYYDTYCRNK
jgi:hypothetical protein